MKSKKTFLFGLFLLITLALGACGDNAATATPASTTQAAATPTTAATTAPATTAAVTTSAPATVAALPTITAAPAATTAPATTAPVATTAPATTVSSANAQAIRKTKWIELMKADPKLENMPETIGGKTETYVSIKGTQLGGIPQIDEIVYLDMDGDGIEEAGIPLNSGGTAGEIGFLVYKQASPAPRLVGWEEGYKMLLKQEQGKLVAVNAIYAGWEPNCCPGGLSYTTYVLKSDKLTTVAERTEGIPEAQQPTVEHFYELLSGRNFDDAYKLLSDAYQKANPYQKWAAGYANTRDIQAEVAPEPKVANTIRVNLTSTDAVASGGTVTKHFSGTWKMSWDGNFKGWRLSDPSFKEVSIAPTIHPAFQPILANLKKQTQVPVLLPSNLSEYDASAKYYANIISASASAYKVEIAYTPDCHEATACSMGSVSAETLGANSPPFKGDAVSLSNGVTGFYIAGHCGSSCADSIMSWKDGKYRYTIAAKGAGLDLMTKLSNSAITNGKL